MSDNFVDLKELSSVSVGQFSPSETDFLGQSSSSMDFPKTSTQIETRDVKKVEKGPKDKITDKSISPVSTKTLSKLRAFMAPSRDDADTNVTSSKNDEGKGMSIISKEASTLSTSSLVDESGDSFERSQKFLKVEKSSTEKSDSNKCSTERSESNKCSLDEGKGGSVSEDFDEILMVSNVIKLFFVRHRCVGKFLHLASRSVLVFYGKARGLPERGYSRVDSNHSH
jgi:hypothetical protein